MLVAFDYLQLEMKAAGCNCDVSARFTIYEGSRRAQIARAAELIAEGANLLSDAGVLIAPASVCSLAPVRWDGATYRADFARVCDLFQRPEFL